MNAAVKRVFIEVPESGIGKLKSLSCKWLESNQTVSLSELKMILGLK